MSAGREKAVAGKAFDDYADSTAIAAVAGGDACAPFKKTMAVDYRFQPKGLRSNLGWYDRGYIPHFDGGAIAQFFTFRLFDSLPRQVVEKWREETKEGGEKGRITFRKNVENYLDKGFGECFLKDQRVAELTQNALLFHHERKYDLKSWVIMPNHIHFLATPLEGVELSEIAHSIKSYTAHEANKILNRKGQFWQQEPFDRYIRNRKHFESVIIYIENNPVKAGLCERPEDWRFSSAFHNQTGAQASRLQPPR